MKTYTIKEILDNPKIIIFIENKEQFDRLSNIKELKLTDYYMGSYCYNPHNGLWSSSSTKTYPGYFSSDSIIIISEQIVGDILEEGENKPKVEVGKWYSFNWDWHSSNSTIIAKIKEINEDSFSISWRSYIWEENNYSTFDRYKFRDISNIKELSIDEVQKYLPENHPDKIKTVQSFEVGKWYKYNGWYLKLKEIKNDLFIASEYIDKDRRYDNNLINFACGEANDEKILLTDLSEIQKYLPEGHPDKIKSNQEFKVGDYVVLQYSSAKEIGHDTIENNTKLKAGHIDKIANFRNGQIWNKNPKIRWVGLESDPHNGVTETLLRHATPEEINNYLISIGQIPAEKYPFKKLEEDDLTWEIKTEGIRRTEPISMTNEKWKPKMILSIDNEELPMLKISKSKTTRIINLD